MKDIWNAIKSIFVNDAHSIISKRGKEILAEQQKEYTLMNKATKAREYNSQLLQELLDEVTPLEMEQTKYEMQLIALIEDLTEQLDKVVKEHPIEVSKDTYWRGVKIGLETAIELVRTINTNEK